MASSSNGRLPIGFKEVEWLQGTGSQYCLTDIYPISDHSNYTCIKGDVVLLDKNNSRFQISTLWLESGSTQYYEVNYLQIAPTGNSRIFTFKYGAGYAYKLEVELNNYVFPLDAHYEINKNNAIFNQTSYTKGASQWSATKPLIIGGYYSSSNSDTVIVRNTQSRLKTFKIYNNDTLIYEIVPCYRTSDNKTGFMKITVADGSTTFFPNMATDEWIIGSVV